MVTVKTWPKELRDFKEFFRLHLQAINNYESSHRTINSKPGLMGDCLRMFIDYLADVGVPSYERKNLTEKYIKSQVNNLKDLKRALSDEGMNTDFLVVTEFSKSHVGIVHDYLESKYAAKTYNHKVSTYRAFFAYLIKQGYEIDNYFDEVRKKHTQSRVKIIPIPLFKELCDTVTPIGGIKIERQIRNGKERVYQRNLYRKWLIDVWRFAMYSGARNNEIAFIKVKDIETDYIRCRNNKVSTKEKEVFRLIYFTNELIELVDQLKKGLSNDDYLLAPDELNRRNMIDVASKAFTHYMNKISDEGFQLYDCRSTYSTELRKVFDSETAHLLGDLHARSTTTIQNYINKQELFKIHKGKKLFG